MKLLYCLLAILCPVSYLCAQVRPFTIGDTMPDLTLHNVYNLPAKSITISELKSELIVFDFWATSCSACIGAFPKVVALKKELQDSITVILVNSWRGDSASRVASFFNRYKERTGISISFPYVLKDTLLGKIFPHQGLPHYVWLDKKRRVLAITSSDDFTPQVARALLQGKASQISQKVDSLIFNPSKMVLGEAQGSTAGSYLYRTAFTTALPHLGGMFNMVADSTELVNRIYALNMQPWQMYQYAFPEVLKYSPLRACISSNKKSLFALPGNTSVNFCYEAIFPPMGRSQALQQMREDLYRFFIVRPVLEVHPLNCLILSVIDHSRIPISKTNVANADFEPGTLNKFFQRHSVATLVELLQRILQIHVEDETSLSALIDVNLPTNIYRYDLPEFNKFLSTIGLSIRKGTRNMEMIVFKN